MAAPTARHPGQPHLEPIPALSSNPVSSQTQLLAPLQASGQADQTARPPPDQGSQVVQASKGPQAPQTPSSLPQPASQGWRFWAIFIPMCVATLLAAVETTVTSTALPTIVAHLHSGDLYVWIMNGYLLTRCVLLRSHGQCGGKRSTDPPELLRSIIAARRSSLCTASSPRYGVADISPSSPSPSSPWEAALAVAQLQRPCSSRDGSSRAWVVEGSVS